MSLSTSPILAAAASNDLATTRWLLEREGVPIDLRGDWFAPETPTNGPGEANNNNANNATGALRRKRRTPLMVAAAHGSLDVLSYLLAAGADVNARSDDDERCTGMHCAASGGSSLAADAIALLMRFGADSGALDARGRAPVDVLPPSSGGISVVNGGSNAPEYGVSYTGGNAATNLATKSRRESSSGASGSSDSGSTSPRGDGGGGGGDRTGGGGRRRDSSGRDSGSDNSGGSEQCWFVDGAREEQPGWGFGGLQQHAGGGYHPQMMPAHPSANPNPTNNSSSPSATGAGGLGARHVGATSSAGPSGGANGNEPDERTKMSDDFRMYEFKVRRCSRTRAHDWTECPFTHPGEKARRRDPRRFNYCGAACPEFRKGSCPRSDACEFSHGVFECWLHPSRYRTQLCKDGSACGRRACFFAHHSSQLRPATDAFGNPLTSQRGAADGGGGLAGPRNSMDGMSGGHGGYESPPQTCPGSNARTPRQSHDGGHGAGAGAAAAAAAQSSDAFAAAVNAAAAALLGGAGYLPPYATPSNGTPLNPNMVHNAQHSPPAHELHAKYPRRTSVDALNGNMSKLGFGENGGPNHPSSKMHDSGGGGAPWGAQSQQQQAYAMMQQQQQQQQQQSSSSSSSSQQQQQHQQPPRPDAYWRGPGGATAANAANDGASLALLSNGVPNGVDPLANAAMLQRQQRTQRRRFSMDVPPTRSPELRGGLRFSAGGGGGPDFRFGAAPVSAAVGADGATAANGSASQPLMNAVNAKGWYPNQNGNLLSLNGNGNGNGHHPGVSLAPFVGGRGSQSLDIPRASSFQHLGMIEGVLGDESGKGGM